MPRKTQPSTSDFGVSVGSGGGGRVAVGFGSDAAGCVAVGLEPGGGVDVGVGVAVALGGAMAGLEAGLAAGGGGVETGWLRAMANGVGVKVGR